MQAFRRRRGALLVRDNTTGSAGSPSVTPHIALGKFLHSWQLSERARLSSFSFYTFRITKQKCEAEATTGAFIATGQARRSAMANTALLKFAIFAMPTDRQANYR